VLTHPAGRLGSPIKKVMIEQLQKKNQEIIPLGGRAIANHSLASFAMVYHLFGREFLKVKPQPV
jgi:hypothetical protein